MYEYKIEPGLKGWHSAFVVYRRWPGQEWERMYDVYADIGDPIKKCREYIQHAQEAEKFNKQSDPKVTDIKIKANRHGSKLPFPDRNKND